MTEAKIENVVGALALALADDLVRATQNHIPVSAPAAALTLVSHASGMTIEELSRALGLSHPGAVRLVDRLVLSGLLIRKQSVKDGRAVALTLTPAGEHMVRRILTTRQETLAHALAKLSPSDRETFGRLAEGMLRGMVKDADHAAEICRLCDPAACPICPVEGELLARQSQASENRS
jgi:DNA-binding MarR family transcriptional regulator